VSLLFAVGQVPGWHSTIFPPYFVLGAAFSGFAVVAMIAIVLRHAFGFDNLVTDRHLDMLGKVLLACGLMTAYGYIFELVDAVYSGGAHELQTAQDRFSGAEAWSYWAAIVLNFVPLQALWFKRVRQSPTALFLIALAVTVGMWFERYMIVVSSLYRDFLVSSWGGFTPTFWEWGVFIGTLGLFLVPYFIFVRLFPVISIAESKETISEERHA
jgi:molybdopterin-containing oxidoreductase family membrane subunit